MKNGGKILKTTLSFLLAALFVWIAFRSVDWPVLFKDLAQTKWAWLILFLAASLLALVFRMLRWQSLLDPLGEPFKMKRIWDANNVGNMVCVAIPGSGELVRCAYMTRGKARYENVLGTQIVERAFDFLAIFLMLGLSLLLSREKFSAFVHENIYSSASERASLWWVAVLAVALIAVLCWAFWHFRTRNKLFAKLWSYVDGLVKGFGTFLKIKNKWLFSFYTVAIWVMYLLMCWSVMKAVPLTSHLGLVDALFLTTVGNLASIIPVPGGIGAYHYLMALALSTIYAASWETGILVATLQHELHAVLIIILGIVSYVGLSRGRNV